MSSASPLTQVVATYRVRLDRKQDFLDLLGKHHPTLLELGLVTKEPPIVYSGEEHGGGPIVFEIFTWVDARAPDTAHQTPEVMRIWEAMGTMCEERDGKPRFDFPHVERIELASGKA